MHHGHLAVARAPQGGRVDLIDAEEEVEGREQPQQQRAVGHHLRLLVEEGRQLRRRAAAPAPAAPPSTAKDRYSAVRTPFLARRRVAHAQILPHEGGSLPWQMDCTGRITSWSTLV